MFSVILYILSKIGKCSLINIISKWLIFSDYTYERLRMNSRQADATARELLFDWQHNSRQADATAREVLFDWQLNSTQADAQTQCLLLRG